MGYAVLIGEKYRERLENGLEREGLSPIWLPDEPNADPRLAGHADLMALKICEKQLIVSQSLFRTKDFVNNLTNRRADGEEGIEAVPAKEPMEPDYPNDARLCACICGGVMFHNLKITDESVLERLPEYIRPVHVNQGYAKCSVCTVSSGALITSDAGIAAAAKAERMDVLFISSGYIGLPGYDTGFIGGASINLPDGCIAFTGRLDKHPDADAIKRFIKSHGSYAVYLTEEPIFDIGGAVTLKTP